MTEHPSGLPAETVTSLIRTALQVYQRGDHAAARTVTRALAARAPNDSRVWLTLAKIAETRDEQRHALEQVIAIDPQHPLAQSSLARFDALSHAPAARPRPAAPPAPVAPPDAHAAPDAAPQIRWPLYVVLGASVLIALLAYALLRPPASATVQPTPALPGAMIGNDPASAASAATPPLPSPNMDAPSPSVAPPANAAVSTAPPSTDAATQPPPPAAPSPVPTVSVPVVPTAATPLAVGQLATAGDWTISLLRPDFALALDGSIGALQPQGRFVLALLSVANTSGTAARMPDGLVMLVDGQGRSYRAVPTASTAYLEAYGRGQRGDFGMEDDLPGGGSIWSVPVIFDVPSTARAFTLQVSDASAGWPVALPAPLPTAGTE